MPTRVLLINRKVVVAFSLHSKPNPFELLSFTIHPSPRILICQIDPTNVHTVKVHSEVLLTDEKGAVIGVLSIVENLSESLCPLLAVKCPLSLPRFASPRISDLEQSDLFISPRQVSVNT